MRYQHFQQFRIELTDGGCRLEEPCRIGMPAATEVSCQLVNTVVRRLRPKASFKVPFILLKEQTDNNPLNIPGVIDQALRILTLRAGLNIDISGQLADTHLSAHFQMEGGQKTLQ